MTPVWDDTVADWVAERVPSDTGFGESRALRVVDRNGVTVAGVVFHSWSPTFGLIEISGAADDRRWATRGVLGEVFRYAFAHHRMVTTKTNAKNEHVKKLWRALGATEYEIKDLLGADEHAAAFTLTEDQWRGSRLCRR